MNILVTGAGGAAAISVWKSLGKDHTLYMADMDPCAAGLYLVPAERRLIIPGGKEARYLPELLALCVQHRIELLIPTVDAELLKIAQHREDFVNQGIQIPLSSVHSLELCRDKYQLLDYCKDTGITPLMQIYDKQFNVDAFQFPCFAKPRVGSGSQGIMEISSPQSLTQLPRDGSYIIQELLTGDEYSVDVYVSRAGHVLGRSAAVKNEN